MNPSELCFNDISCLQCGWHYRWLPVGQAPGWWIGQTSVGSSKCKTPWTFAALSPQGIAAVNKALVWGSPLQCCPPNHHQHHHLIKDERQKDIPIKYNSNPKKFGHTVKSHHNQLQWSGNLISPHFIHKSAKHTKCLSWHILLFHDKYWVILILMTAACLKYSCDRFLFSTA